MSVLDVLVYTVACIIPLGYFSYLVYIWITPPRPIIIDHSWVTQPEDAKSSD